MAYTKQGFANGQTLTAEMLIEMEEGIIEAQSSSGEGSGMTEEEIKAYIDSVILGGES